MAGCNLVKTLKIYAEKSRENGNFRHFSIFAILLLFNESLSNIYEFVLKLAKILVNIEKFARIPLNGSVGTADKPTLADF